MLKSIWNNLCKGSVKMDTNYYLLRRTTLGGFNRKDVIDYIEKLKNEYADYKADAEKTIKELRDEISELKAGKAECVEVAETAESEIAAQEVEAYDSVEAYAEKCTITDLLCTNCEVNADDEESNALPQKAEDIKLRIYETIKNFSFDFEGEATENVTENQKRETASVLDTISTFVF